MTSKYFPEPINPKPAPTFQERTEAAIRDLEKRIVAQEVRAKYRYEAPVWLTSNGSEDRPATEYYVRRVVA